MSCCDPCDPCNPRRQQPLLRAVATDVTLGGLYLQPSGRYGFLSLPIVTASVTFHNWDGFVWSPTGIIRPTGGAYTQWNTLIPPSTMISNMGGVNGVLPDAWSSPRLSISSASGRFAVAGLQGVVPRLTLYSNTLTVIDSVILEGPPALIAYDQ